MFSVAFPTDSGIVEVGDLAPLSASFNPCFPYNQASIRGH